ncbi:MAG: DNA repair protein RecN [Burkholderiales bacterium]
MLVALNIRDFVIVDRARLEFPPGFTVLTGETGAGKSILVDALLLVLGGRADAGVVRAGQERAEITAEFDLVDSTPAEAWLAANDLAEPGGECILRRVVESGGRSRAYINGQPCTVTQLRELGGTLVDIHGQHEHQSLMRPAEQRQLLDAHGDSTALVAEVAALHRQWRAAEEALHAAQAGAAALEEERDRLSWQVRELDELSLSADGWQELQTDHSRLAHAAALIEGAEAGMDALSEGETATLPQVASVATRLRQLAQHDPALEEITGLLDAAQIQLEEAVRGLRHYRQRLDVDPARLRDMETRIDAVVSLSRKHRVTPEALPEHHATLRARLQALGESLDAGALTAKATQAKTDYLRLARTLSGRRQAAAKRLSQAVTDVMQTLAMAGGRLEIAMLPLPEPAAFGLEQVEFRMTGHAGTAPAPLAKVASGGELARLSLAIQTVASSAAPVSTLIFDEVDAGIGGGVAEIVGQRLRSLGESHQVLCITHLPQVASAGTAQWRVSKFTDGGRTLSRVEALDAGQRVEEIARMLGGVKITETTRRHAAEMLGMPADRPATR